MARRSRETIDYFPHDVNHGKTMKILEERYRNDGYAFWFKLLEVLGKYPGHYLDCNNETDWYFLMSETHVDENTCTGILDLLAKLDAIDRDLWKGARTVWSQNFVNRLEEVYKKRKLPLPEKPSLPEKTPAENGISGAEMHAQKDFRCGNASSAVVSGAEMRQSKVNKSKVNKKDHLSSNDEDDDISHGQKPTKSGRVKPGDDCAAEIEKHLSAYDPETRLLVKSFIAAVASLNKTGEMTQGRYLSLLCELSAVSATADKRAFMEALKKGIKANAGTVNYIKAILANKQSQGIIPLPVLARPDPPKIGYEYSALSGWYRVEGQTRTKISEAEVPEKILRRHRGDLSPPDPVNSLIADLANKLKAPQEAHA